MKKTIFFAGAIIIISAWACKPKKAAVKEEGDELSGMVMAVKGNDGFIEVDKAYQGPAKGDPFTITDMSVKGDSLYLAVQYSGGCKEHEFTMITHGNFLKSLPPKLPLFLEHNGNQDNCRALKIEKLAFDLKPLRSPQTKKIKVYVNDQPDKSVDYEYK